MKRFLSMIVAVCAFLAASAESPMVTLSHNGELSFFTNLTAFEAAVAAAENGDTIYLSEGDFVISGGVITITKTLNIVGNGYGSHLLGNFTISITSDNNISKTAPLFDGVRLDKVSFSSGNKLDEAEIRRCWIKELENGAYAASNITYDKCYIEKSNFSGTGTVLVTNSKVIGTGSTNDYTCNISAINSNISNPYWYPRTMISCIFQRGAHNTSADSGKTYSIIKSVLDFTPNKSNVYLNDCYLYTDDSVPLLDGNLDCPLNLTELGYLGQDGTEVGIHGGESPFSENPSVPTVDTAHSSVEYDTEGNKLKVSITVNAD